MRKMILKIAISLLIILNIQVVLAGISRNESTTSIEITYNGDEPLDSLQLIIFDEDFIPISSVKHEAYRRYVANKMNGKFIFEFSVKGCRYFKVFLGADDLKGKAVLQRNLLEQGDHVKVHINKDQISFYGKGSHKMMIMENYERQNAYYRDSVMNSYQPKILANKQVEYLFRYIIEKTKLEKLWIKKLDEDKNLTMSSKRYLLGEIIGLIRFSCYLASNVLLKNNVFSNKEKHEICSYLIINKHEFADVQNMPEYFSSDRFVQGELQKELFVYNISNLELVENERIPLDYLIRLPSKDVGWEKLLTYYVFRAYQGFKNKDQQLKEISQTFRSQYLKEEMLNILTMKNEQKNFKLFDNTGKLVSLANFRGKPVFIDFWFIGCHACGKYFNHSVSKAEEEFGDKIVFISVCIEKDFEKWNQAIRTGIYTSENVLNLYTGVESWKSEAVKNFGISAAPSPFLLDRDGKVFSMDTVELGLGNYENLKQTMLKIVNN